jgi:hypothetical protein
MHGRQLVPDRIATRKGNADARGAHKTGMMALELTPGVAGEMWISIYDPVLV